MNKVLPEYLEGVAWDCVAAGQNPPLHPTTCAVIRLVALLGSCRFYQLSDIVPCSEVTLRQQLSRLQRAGVVEKKMLAGPDGRKHGYYMLTAGGVRMVLTWRREHARLLGVLKSKVKK